MQPLTHRQQETLAFVTQYVEKHGYAPVMREIVEGTRHKSTSTVQKDLDILVRKGYVRRSRGTSRAIILRKYPGPCPHNVVEPHYHVGAANGFICEACSQFWSLEEAAEIIRRAYGTHREAKRDPARP